MASDRLILTPGGLVVSADLKASRMFRKHRTGSRARDTAGEDRLVPDHPDMKLVKEVLGRSQAGVVEFMDRLSCVPRILAAKNAMMGRPLTETELQDVSQEVLLLVWRKLPDYRGHSNLEAWVYRLTINELMNRVRHTVRRRAHSLSDDDAVESGGIVLPVEIEDYRFVYDALDRLPADEQVVVRAKHFDELSFTEIGRRFGLPSNTVKTRYYRGMLRLRTHLHKHEEEYK